MSVYIIAEAGASHGGDVSVAIDLVYAAKKAGADCVKFQIWNTEKFIAPSSSFYHSFKKAELSYHSWEFIKAHCDEAGIDFLASAFDIESVDFLDSLGVKAFKVASADIVYGPLIQHIKMKNKPVFLSTGMATQGEIIRALGWLGNGEVTLLKCTVDYPCAEEDVNLAGIQKMKWMPYPIGFSDHTKGYLASCMAVGAGAIAIEKHFALKETVEAIGADNLIEFVKKVRMAERIMGSGELRTFPCEEKWKAIARRGESGLRE